MILKRSRFFAGYFKQFDQQFFILLVDFLNTFLKLDLAGTLPKFEKFVKLFIYIDFRSVTADRFKSFFMASVLELSLSDVQGLHWGKHWEIMDQSKY